MTQFQLRAHMALIIIDTVHHDHAYSTFKTTDFNSQTYKCNLNTQEVDNVLASHTFRTLKLCKESVLMKALHTHVCFPKLTNNTHNDSKLCKTVKIFIKSYQKFWYGPNRHRMSFSCLNTFILNCNSQLFDGSYVI